MATGRSLFIVNIVHYALLDVDLPHLESWPGPWISILRSQTSASYSCSATSKTSFKILIFFCKINLKCLNVSEFFFLHFNGASVKRSLYFLILREKIIRNDSEESLQFIIFDTLISIDSFVVYVNGTVKSTKPGP